MPIRPRIERRERLQLIQYANKIRGGFDVMFTSISMYAFMRDSNEID